MKAFYLILSIGMAIVLGSCAVPMEESAPINMPAEKEVVVNFDEITIVDTQDYFASYCGNRDNISEDRPAFRVHFVLEREWSWHEITAHADHFIKEMSEEHFGLVGLILHYHESELFYKSGDQEVALLEWSQYGRITDGLLLEPGDYTNYEVSIAYYPNHPEHQLTEEELRLYDVLQTYMIEQTGEPLSGIYDVEAEYKEYCEMICYEHVAEQQGVTVMDILELRNKESLQHRENALQLTDEEVALYDILKSYAMEEMGEPLGPVYNLDWYGGAYDKLACYGQVAEEQGASVLDLMELRHKAFLWREEEIDTHIWVE